MDGRGADDAQWLTAEERRAWLAVAGLMVKLPAALDAQLQADAGLSFFEYMVLAVLSEQPDRSLRMSDIAEFSSASLSRLSHTAKRLEEQGLLVRQQVPGHGRRTLAVLTDAGHDKVRNSAPGHVTQVRRLLIDGLSASQLEVLGSVGEKVLANIVGSSGPTCRSTPSVGA